MELPEEILTNDEKAEIFKDFNDEICEREEDEEAKCKRKMKVRWALSDFTTRKCARHDYVKTPSKIIQLAIKHVKKDESDSYSATSTAIVVLIILTSLALSTLNDQLARAVQLFTGTIATFLISYAMVAKSAMTINGHDKKYWKDFKKIEDNLGIYNTDITPRLNPEKNSDWPFVHRALTALVFIVGAIITGITLLATHATVLKHGDFTLGLQILVLSVSWYALEVKLTSSIDRRTREAFERGEKRIKFQLHKNIVILAVIITAVTLYLNGIY